MEINNQKSVLAIYPGSFDPMTVGHLDLIQRASAIFDRLIVCVMINRDKKCLFTETQRVEQLQRVLKNLDNVSVDVHYGLAVDYARAHHADVIVRGLRTPTDYAYESNICYFNRRIAPEIETVYLGSSPEFEYISSSAVRELLAFGGDISGLVPKEIEDAVRESQQPSQKTFAEKFR